MPTDDYANSPNMSRSEEIIQSILDGTEYDEPARSRIEYLLKELKAAIEAGGGGGGFTPTQAQLDAMNSGIDITKVTQIATNTDDISDEQDKTVGMSEGGSNYITVGGIRVYVSATAPTGNITDGSVGVGW
jgi:hypothetical protein